VKHENIGERMNNIRDEKNKTVNKKITQACNVKTEDILHFLACNLNYVQRHFHIVKIALFGSFARYEQQDDSDIDILIELQDKTPHIYELKNELREFIGNRFQRQVDIAREKYLKPSFRQRILKEAIYVGERQTEPGKYTGSDSKN